MSAATRLDAAGNRAGDALGRVPGPGRRLGGIVAAAASLAGAVAAGVAGLACRPRDLPAATAGALIVVLGKVVALGQAAVRPRRCRPPTDEERALLTAVFRGSVDLRAVRIVPGPAGVFGASRRPFTLGSTIYLKDDTRPATLVHEGAHVWQYQHLGSRYTADALWAQYRVRPSAYRWEHELDRGRRAWREFNREAQAQFLEDIAAAAPGLFADDPARQRVRFTLGRADHTELARATVAEVRATTGRYRPPTPPR